MKKYQKHCLLLFMVLGIPLIDFSKGPLMDQMPESEKIYYEFLNREGKEIGIKFGMRQCGSGGGAKDGLTWLISLSFQRYDSLLTEEEARKLIIEVVYDFLEAVNHDAILKPYLRDNPFTSKNIELTIYNYDRDKRDVYYPFIGVVSNREGKIGYFTTEESNKYRYKTEKYETYDEAVAILQK